MCSPNKTLNYLWLGEEEKKKKGEIKWGRRVKRKGRGGTLQREKIFYSGTGENVEGDGALVPTHLGHDQGGGGNLWREVKKRRNHASIQEEKFRLTRCPRMEAGKKGENVVRRRQKRKGIAARICNVIVKEGDPPKSHETQAGLRGGKMDMPQDSEIEHHDMKAQGMEGPRSNS